MLDIQKIILAIKRVYFLIERGRFPDMVLAITNFQKLKKIKKFNDGEWTTVRKINFDTQKARTYINDPR